MTRLPGMVVPGLAHYVTQRGNRREAIFFEDGDQQIYCDMLAEQRTGCGQACGRTWPVRMTACIWRPVLNRWPNFRDLLPGDFEEDFTSLRKAEGIGCPAGHGGLRNRIRTPAWQTDCPSGSKAEGCADLGGRAVKTPAIGKLSSY